MLTYKDFDKSITHNTINPIANIVTCGNEGFSEPTHNFRTRSDLVVNQQEEAIFSPLNYSYSNYLLEKYSERSVSSISTLSLKDKSKFLSPQEIYHLNSHNWPSNNIPYKTQRVGEEQNFYDYSRNIFSDNRKLKISESCSNTKERNKGLALDTQKGIVDFNVTKCDIDKTLKLDTQIFNNLFTDKPARSFERFEMSGQYPGHSRPPVGTPPPQTVWNHLTMTQGQGI